MVVDHLALFLLDGGVLRQTVGRLALPLFFIVGGHLVRRLSWRLAWVFLVGAALPLAVPWVDNPNVLGWYALGAAVLTLTARWPWLPALLVAFALTRYANEAVPYGPGYSPLALLALMALGQLLPREAFRWGRHLPSPLALLGRYPLTFYVGHLFAIEAVRSL